MENSEIRELDIYQDRNFYIDALDDGYYVFYNPIRHFACKISELDLLLFNLIYKYKSLDVILEHIEPLYTSYILNLYRKVEESNVLNLSLEKPSEIEYQLPSSYYLHLTYKCNLGCTYCYNKDIRTDFKELSNNNWYRIIDQVSIFAERIILTGGEPFLFKNIDNIIRYIRSKPNSIYVEIISNCMTDFSSYANTDEIFNNINAITFSCDNLSDVNQTRKNFDVNLFKKNVLYLRNRYPQIAILISSVFIKGSEGELNLINEFCQEANVRFKSVLVIPGNKDDEKLLPSIPEYKSTLISSERDLETLRQFCGAGIGSCSIDPKGNVYPCQSMHYSDFYCGNILENDLREILAKDKSQFVRSQYSVDKIEVCKDCNLRYICGAGCRAATYKLEGDPMKYPEILCPYYKELSIHKLRNIPIKRL